MSGITVLVVEHEDSYRAYLAKTLQEAGFQTVTAVDGQTALDQILAARPQVLILDFHLPDTTGDQICRTIKTDPLLKEIIVIVLSSSTQVETKLSCFSSGANEFLVKPVEGRELIARIKGFLRMVDEFRGLGTPTPVPNEASSALSASSPALDAKQKSFPTVEIIGAGGDSSVRIRPKYGVYRIENLVGSGAMGHVFKAYDEPLERFVAVKILSKRLSSSASFVERFRREAKVLAALNHPGIAFIYSFGEEEGEHYFAMQWCSGGSVADLVRRKQQVELLPAVEIVLQSAQALSAASKKGVVHRDIKPSNILFDENQQVKIVDFGLALAERASARITQVQEFLGTPGYMAPEQAQSASVDHRADIYSLGITFYCMLYGRPPYKAGTAIEMVIKHASQPFPAHQDLGGKIPRYAYEIIEKMTKKNPEDRYPDYATLIQDLETLRNTLLSESQWKIPRAENIAPIPKWKGSNLFDILIEVYRNSPSGVLTVRWGPLQKRFLVRNRDIILFESSQQEENIWSALIQKKLLREDHPPMSEGLEASLNRFLLKHAFTMEQFRTAYRDLMKVAVMQVFFWPIFEGQFATASVEHDAFATINIADLLLEASRTLIDYQKLKKDLPWDRSLARTSQFEQVLSTLSLKPEESFIASRVEGPDITLHTLQLLTGLPEENIAKFVYAMERMGGLQFKTPEERHPPRKAPPPPPPPAANSSPAPAASKSGRASARSSSGEDYWMQTMADRKFVKTDDEKAKRQAIEQVTQQVRMEVIKSDRKIETEHHIKVAEQFFQLAQDKFVEGDYWKVAQLCKQALKNHPTEAKYYHLMANAYAQHPRFGKDAEQCFCKALELDPWNTDYHLDLAVFYAQHQLSKRALNHCQKALQIAPQNEKAKRLLAKLTEK